MDQERPYGVSFFCLNIFIIVVSDYAIQRKGNEPHLIGMRILSTLSNWCKKTGVRKDH